MFEHPSEFVTFKATPHLPGIELYSARLVDHAFAPHVHDGYSIGAIEDGVERFRYRGADHVAPAGSLVLLNPDELHTGEAEVESGWTYQMLYIEPDTLRAMTGSETWFPDAAVLEPALADSFRQVFRTLWNAQDDLAFVSGFTPLVDAIVARYGNNIRVPDRTTGRMQRVRDCIEAQLDQTLHIDMLAAEAGLSVFHFVRAFSACFHATPHQYVQARRAARAKSLLARKVAPSETAAAVGLTDQSHLNRWFKRTYGVTPGQYQQQIGTRPADSKRSSCMT